MAHAHHPKGNALKPHPCKAALALLAFLLVNVAQAEISALDAMRIPAQLSPQRYTTLSSELSAKINRLTLRDGESFKRGQALVEFDCELQAAQLDKAKVQLAGAENVLSGNQRLANLNAVGQVELRNSEVEVMKAQADIAYLEAGLRKCTISAPYDGRVVELKAREQQFVQPGQALLEILDDSALEFHIIVPSRWLSWFKPGHAFQVHIEETDKTYPVKLLGLAAKADPVSQSIKAIAVIDGQFPELIPGLSGRVVIKPPKRK